MKTITISFGINVEQIKTYGNPIDNVVDLFNFHIVKMLIRHQNLHGVNFQDTIIIQMGKPVMCITDELKDIVEHYKENVLSKIHKPLIYLQHMRSLGKIPKEFQRPSPEQIKKLGYDWNQPHEIVEIFEKEISNVFWFKIFSSFWLIVILIS